MKNTTWKSIWAVLAGFLIVAILSTITDTILEATHIFTPINVKFDTTWMIILALLYRTVYTVLGGYVTARLAPQNPMKHVIILACIGTFAAVVGLVATWGKDLGPEWYPITLAVLSFPSVWYGGTLYRSTKVNT